VVGPALGGLILLWSVPAAYVAAALSSLVYLAMLAKLNLRHIPVAEPSGSPVENLLAGIRFVSRTRVILAMITLDMFGVLLGGAVYLLPIYATEILNVGEKGFGWLRAAPAFGALCMAVLLIYLPPMKRAGWSLLWNVAGFGAATIVFGLSTSFWLSFVMLFLTGAFDNVSMVIRQTLQQMLTPDHMRGRVSAVSAVFISASNELGGLESGLVAHWFGPVFSAVSGGIGTLVVVALTGWFSPELRNLGALHEAKPVEEPAVEPHIPSTFAPKQVLGASSDD
jgi:MFS family permease